MQFCGEFPSYLTSTKPTRQNFTWNYIMKNIGVATSPMAWMNPQHVPLLLKEDMNSFLRTVGLIILCLDKAKSYMEKLDRVLVRSLLG